MIIPCCCDCLYSITYLLVNVNQKNDNFLAATDTLLGAYSQKLLESNKMSFGPGLVRNTVVYSVLYVILTLGCDKFQPFVGQFEIQSLCSLYLGTHRRKEQHSTRSILFSFYILSTIISVP